MNTWTTDYDSPIGTLVLAATERGLSGLHFEAAPARANSAAWIEDRGRFSEVMRQLDGYFAGQRQAFDLALDLHGTEFQRRVWSALCGIGYGKTESYGGLARRLGSPSAMRAVGLANGRNPVAIIVPCHRVIGADGSLTGFGGGLPRKRFLLALEGREFALVA